MVLLVTAFSVIADEAVKFYGAGNSFGLPEYWPQVIQHDATNAPAGFVLLTQAQLDEIISTNQPAYNLWESNRAYIAQAKLDANLARIVELFQQIPAGRTSMTNIMNATISNVAQASTHIKTLANVMDKILEELQRLGPVLKEAYKPETDNTP